MNKRKLILSVIIILTLTITFVIVNVNKSTNFLNKDKVTDNINKISKKNYSMYMQREDESGYDEIDIIPTEAILNTSLSICTDNNGKVLTGLFDYNNGYVTVTSSVTTFCYLYFDIKPSDIKVTTTYNGTSGMPSTVGAYATLNCDSATGEYDSKYNLKITGMSASTATCTLDYTDRSDTTPLNTYIKNKIPSGSTISSEEGDGYVVHEIAVIPDYDSGVKLTESEYGTTVMYLASSFSTSSGTDLSGGGTPPFSYDSENNVWTNNPDNMTASSSSYYHAKHTIAEEGYYQVCFNLGTGNSYLYVYNGTTQIKYGTSSYVYGSTSASKTGCFEVGKVSAGGTIRVVDRTYTTVSTLTYWIEKAPTEDVDTGIRYEGSNPKNYVWFNDELWRIIGVFDVPVTDSDGNTETKSVTKIIRANSIGGLVWHTSSSNTWSSSALKSLLNGAYLNKTSETCYGYSSTITSTCDYSEIGIDDAYENMIASVTWYVNASTNSAYVGDLYVSERNGTTLTNTKIGLMYASDYGYSTLGDNNGGSCSRTGTMVSGYDTANCAGKSWLYGQGYEWTITPSSDDGSGYALFVDNNGYVYDSPGVTYGIAVRPSLYLDASVYIIDGDGSISDPYIIGM